MKSRYVFVIALCAALVLVVPYSVTALPQFSLLSGNKCLNCHVNNQGSGLRGELGWYMEKEMALLKPRSVGLGWHYDLDRESNSFFDGALTFGLDFRMQSARKPTSAEAERRIFPMQLAFYAAWQATSWLTLEGTYNAGPLRYAGQQSWAASVVIQPTLTSPQLRVGFFQPSIGVRYDDHTMIVRGIAGADYNPLIAPNYAEYGAEITYDGLQWLTLTAGAFLPKSLSQLQTVNQKSETVPLLDGLDSNSNFSTLAKSPTMTAKAMLWLRTEDHVINSYIGASVLNNKAFTFLSAFAGVGLTDRLSLMGEYALSGVKDGRQTRNMTAELSYQPVTGLLPFVRYDRGRTRIAVPNDVTELAFQQISVGAQIFLLPYVELRPEYRWTDTDAYTSTRWTVQLHIFY